MEMVTVLPKVGEFLRREHAHFIDGAPRGINPWEAIESLIDRENGSDQRISVETAIDSITRNAAVAMKLDAVAGSIEPGKSADMVFLNRNPFAIPVSEIKKVIVQKTLFEGRVVYQSEIAARRRANRRLDTGL